MQHLHVMYLSIALNYIYHEVVTFPLQFTRRPAEHMWKGKTVILNRACALEFSTPTSIHNTKSVKKAGNRPSENWKRRQGGNCEPEEWKCTRRTTYIKKKQQPGMWNDEKLFSPPMFRCSIQQPAKIVCLVKNCNGRVAQPSHSTFVICCSRQ